MHREVHIVVSDWGTRFTLRGMAGEEHKTFPSLFEAARHARTMSDSTDGCVVVSDESGRPMSRIPFYVPGAPEAS